MNVQPHSARKIPTALSMISAGPLSEIVDDYQLLDVNALITGGREGYICFEVTGDSMVEQIQPGNLVFVDSWAAPENGDIVAATVNGLTCVKIFRHRNNHLYLVSANSKYRPREITPEDSFQVLGVVRGHLALYRR